MINALGEIILVWFYFFISFTLETLWKIITEPQEGKYDEPLLQRNLYVRNGALHPSLVFALMFFRDFL